MTANTAVVSPSSAPFEPRSRCAATWCSHPTTPRHHHAKHPATQQHMAACRQRGATNRARQEWWGKKDAKRAMESSSHLQSAPRRLPLGGRGGQRKGKQWVRQPLRQSPAQVKRRRPAGGLRVSHKQHVGCALATQVTTKGVPQPTARPDTATSKCTSPTHTYTLSHTHPDRHKLTSTHARISTNAHLLTPPHPTPSPPHTTHTTLLALPNTRPRARVPHL
jgi:hypothetical protein